MNFGNFKWKMMWLFCVNEFLFKFKFSDEVLLTWHVIWLWKLNVWRQLLTTTTTITITKILLSICARWVFIKGCSGVFVCVCICRVRAPTRVLYLAFYCCMKNSFQWTFHQAQCAHVKTPTVRAHIEHSCVNNTGPVHRFNNQTCKTTVIYMSLFHFRCVCLFFVSLIVYI